MTVAINAPQTPTKNKNKNKTNKKAFLTGLNYHWTVALLLKLTRAPPPGAKLSKHL